jgi:hypothetical protein
MLASLGSPYAQFRKDPGFLLMTPIIFPFSENVSQGGNQSGNKHWVFAKDQRQRQEERELCSSK